MDLGNEVRIETGSSLAHAAIVGKGMRLANLFLHVRVCVERMGMSKCNSALHFVAFPVSQKTSPLLEFFRWPLVVSVCVSV